jgi:hypothetical protein
VSNYFIVKIQLFMLHPANELAAGGNFSLSAAPFCCAGIVKLALNWVCFFVPHWAVYCHIFLSEKSFTDLPAGKLALFFQVAFPRLCDEL